MAFRFPISLMGEIMLIFFFFLKRRTLLFSKYRNTSPFFTTYLWHTKRIHWWRERENNPSHAFLRAIQEHAPKTLLEFMPSDLAILPRLLLITVLFVMEKSWQQHECPMADGWNQLLYDGLLCSHYYKSCFEIIIDLKKCPQYNTKW